MKESLTLLEHVFMDVSRQCTTIWSKDFKTIKSRVRNEGLSFLTITMPTFSEQFFTCLENGVVTSNDFVGWKKRLCLPAFLQGFTSLVFDQSTGVLRNDANVKAICSIRQICLLFKKINLPCSRDREKQAISSYIDTDAHLGTIELVYENPLRDFFKRVSRLIISTITDDLSIEELIPHHGPGSTFERCRGNTKYKPQRCHWYTQLEPYFQPSMFYNTDESEHMDNSEFKKVCSESTVKVITVPKTLKTPRVIAMEPVAMQMAQQSLKDWLVKKIESSRLTKGHINFSDQSVNQKLALQSSETRRLATLDLSEASDRVHNEYVIDMLMVNPLLCELVQVTRSNLAAVGGEVIRLNKFASMGSALCFPIESLYFYVLCIISHCVKHNNFTPSYNDIKLYTKDTYIYGDDIIVPVNVVDTLVLIFEEFGNKISQKKSFSKGSFRESCGVDAYNGVDITPTYLRSTYPEKRSDAGKVISIIETANQFFDKGFFNSYTFLKEKCESVIGKLPQVKTTCAGLGWRDTSFEGKERYNTQFQRREVRTLVPTPIFKKDRLAGYNALAKCLLNLVLKTKNQSEDGSISQFVPKLQIDGIKLNLHDWSKVLVNDERHLARSVERGTLALKYRWVTPY